MLLSDNVSDFPPTNNNGEVLDMKNIVYRAYDDRFMGRKMINGVTITVYAKTLKECQQNLRLALKQTIRPEEKTKNVMTFETCWNKWFSEEKKPFVKLNTIKDIEYLFRKLKPLYKHQMRKLTKEVLLEFLNKLPANRDREKIYLYLGALFKWAYNNRFIARNPFDTIRKPMVKKKHKPAFRFSEQVTILENLKGTTLYPVIIVYLCTGMRKNEFDFKNIEKNIDYENCVLKAENLKGRGEEIRYKNIHISRELCEFILTNKDIIHTYTPDSAYREFADFLKKINIKGSIVTCRHTYATNNFYLGNPELFISRNMGHASSQITKDNYTDIDYNLSKEKILKLYNNLYRIF